MTDPRDDDFGCNANDAFSTAASFCECAADSASLVVAHSATDDCWGSVDSWTDSDSCSSSDWSSSDW